MLQFDIMKASIIGHRKVKDVQALALSARRVFAELVREGVSEFLLGSRGACNAICHSVLRDLKSQGLPVKLVYVRAEYPDISDQYRDYLLTEYDLTYMPDGVERAGNAAYVERNRHMIDSADVCVFYLDPDYVLPDGKSSGTLAAYRYAL